MATVKIITFTGKGIPSPAYPSDHMPQESEYAARLLAFTKNTRLNMTPEGFDAFLEKPWAEIEKELAYMATTIPSAWEFVDVVFSIENVSRACAQQITRTRNAVYQMQSQRVTDMSSVTVHTPESVKDKDAYEFAVHEELVNYQQAIERGESLEDARGLLPMNVHCNLVAKYNLRALVELLRARNSLRVQGEYQDIAAQMKAQVLQIWPWAAPFFVPKQQQAIDLIESVASEIKQIQGLAHSSTILAKAADLLKKD